MDPQPTPAPAPPAPPAPTAPAPAPAPAPPTPPAPPAPASGITPAPVTQSNSAPAPSPAPAPQGEPTIAALQAQIVRLEAQGVMLRSGVAGLDDPDVESLFLEKFKASGEASFSAWFAKVKATPPAVLKPFITAAPPAPAPGAPPVPGAPPAPVRSAINPGAQPQAGTAAVYTPEQIKAILADPEQAKVHGAAIRAQLGLPGAPPSRTFNPSQFGKS